MFFTNTVEIHDDFLIAARWNHINHLAISKFNMAYFISYFKETGRAGDSAKGIWQEQSVYALCHVKCEPECQSGIWKGISDGKCSFCTGKL